MKCGREMIRIGRFQNLCTVSSVSCMRLDVIHGVEAGIGEGSGVSEET